MRIAAITLTLSRAASALTALGSVMYFTRTRSVGTVGDINALLAVSQSASLLMSLGLSTSLIYFAKADSMRARDLTFISYASSALFMLVLLTTSHLIFPEYFYVVLSSGILALLAHFSGYLQSREQFIQYGLLIFIQALCVPFSNFLSMRLPDDASSFFSCYAISLSLVFIASNFFYFRTNLPNNLLFAKSRPNKFFSYGANAFTFNAISALYYSMDILLIKFLFAASYLGTYSIASTIAKSSWLVVDSLGMVIFPRKISGRLSSSDYQRVQLFCLAYSLLAMAVWWAVGERLIILLFGSEYIEATRISLVLLLASVFVGYYKLQSRILAAENRWRMLNIAQTIGILGGVCLISVLRSKGSLGVAWGQTGGFMVCSLYIYFASHRKRTD